MVPQPVDLLLVNASNYPRRPIFPYAFVQVSALARRERLTVARLDLSRFARVRWPSVIERALRALPPRAVGLHLRQTDSMIPSDVEGADPYLPVRRTREVADLVRAAGKGDGPPIVVGGFGFSVQPDAMLHALGADAGVEGEPDDFFRHFDAFASRRLSDASNVKNLIPREGRRGPRETFGPLDEAEYTPAIIRELKKFYGEARLSSPEAPAVPVEVSRGCPYQCFFCAEPRVKGRSLRRRNMDAVFDDVERLARADIRKIWFVCSEANIGGKGMLLELAARVRALRERLGGPAISWTTYVLPHLDADDLRELYASGWYVGGFNDVPSLDDAELIAAKVPYRAKHALSFLRALQETAADATATTDDVALNRRRHLGLFLASPDMTDAGLRTTLDRLDEAGLLPGAQHDPAFDSAYVVTALRVWNDASDVSRPTFVVPRALAARFGGGLRGFTDYLERVLLSPARRRAREASRRAFVERRRRRLMALAGRAAPSEGDALYASALAAVHTWLTPLWDRLGVARSPAGAPVASDWAVSKKLLTHVDKRVDLVRLVDDYVPREHARLAATLLAFEYALPLDARIRTFLYPRIGP